MGTQKMGQKVNNCHYVGTKKGNTILPNLAEINGSLFVSSKLGYDEIKALLCMTSW